MLLQILGSSSSGNCALLVTEQCRVLIDAGFSTRRICAFLEANGESINSIDAIFLTHEHSDHTAGLTGLSRFPHIRVFANFATAKAIQNSLKRKANWQIFETGRTFYFRNLEITSFPVPHDALDPVGFVFASGGEDLFNPRRSIAWCLDLGHIPQLVREHVRPVNVLVLEANYEADMLDEDQRRPWSVKQRIKSRHGHLSNASALEFLRTESEPSWEKVFLVHLSKNCNDVSLLSSLIEQSPSQGENRKFTISIVDPNGGCIPPYQL